MDGPLHMQQSEIDSMVLRLQVYHDDRAWASPRPLLEEVCCMIVMHRRLFHGCSRMHKHQAAQPESVEQ